MSYIFDAAAEMSALATVSVWPWLPPIIVVVPFMRQFGGAASAPELPLPHAVSSSAPAAPATVVTTELRNSLRVKFIGTSCSGDTTWSVSASLRRGQQRLAEKLGARAYELSADRSGHEAPAVICDRVRDQLARRRGQTDAESLLVCCASVTRASNSRHPSSEVTD